MKNQAYKSEVLLAQLRAARPSNAVEECEMCELQHKIVCEHLTEDQYALLKARKRRVSNDRKKGIELRVFQCGHVYRFHRRAWLDIDRTKKTKTRDLCSECWRYIATDGRRVCLETVGKVRPRRQRTRKPELDSTSKTSLSLPVPKRRRARYVGEFKYWRVRGPMVGGMEV
ncbi:hypothetical protein F5Y14DRAFT_465373 [Nemania sp. NC0429]|nr:hypothetical protein F5Y14DRAFT_465373 [Nemania sp. NC0429]